MIGAVEAHRAAEGAVVVEIIQEITMEVEEATLRAQAMSLQRQIRTVSGTAVLKITMVRIQVTVKRIRHTMRVPLAVTLSRDTEATKVR